MFFEGYTGNYVCLRPRPRADCAWVRREAVGEVVEVFPGRTLEQGNKDVPCPSSGKVVDKSFATETDIRQKWRASGPQNAGEQFAAGILSGALGIVTGRPGMGPILHNPRLANGT
jgi:hypothetical protein